MLVDFWLLSVGEARACLCGDSTRLALDAAEAVAHDGASRRPVGRAKVADDTVVNEVEAVLHVGSGLEDAVGDPPPTERERER